MTSPRLGTRVALFVVLALMAALPVWARTPDDVGPRAGESWMSICVYYEGDGSLVAGAHVRYVDGTWTMIDEVTDGVVCPGHMTTGITGGTATVLSLPPGLAVCRNAGADDVTTGYDPYYGWVVEEGQSADHVSNPEDLARLGVFAVVQPGWAHFWVGPLLTDIQGTVWQDSNGNGVRDSGEELGAYDIEAYRHGALVRRMTVPDDGIYHLAIFEPGTYRIAGQRIGDGGGRFEREIVINAGAQSVTPLDLEVGAVPTSTPTPTATPEPGTVMIHGLAQDAVGQPVAGMVAHLSRESGGWLPIRDCATGADGIFRTWISPIPGSYRIVAESPAGWAMVSAALPAGVSGEVAGADTLTFALPDGASEMGPFTFALEAAPAPTLPPPPPGVGLTPLGQVSSPSVVWGVAVTDTLCLLGATDSGLRVIQSASPVQPVEIGALDTSGFTRGVAVSGERAYLADGPGGLVIVDLADPAEPRRLGSCDTYAAIDVVVSGTVAYVADYAAGLVAIDVSEPISPTVLGHLASDYAMDVDVVGALAYLADDEGGLRIVDVSDAAALVELGQWVTAGSAKGVDVVGALAYVADSWGGLRILDVSDPAAPVEIGACATAAYAWSVQMRGKHAYVADGLGGIRVIDVADPANPVEVGAYAPGAEAYDLALWGDYVYASQGAAGMVVLGPDIHCLRLPMVLRPKR